LHYSAGGDVSFHSVEEGEEEDGDSYSTLDVQESVCQGVSVLVMGSSNRFGSCDEAQMSGWTRNNLSSTWSARLASGQSRMGRS